MSELPLAGRAAVVTGASGRLGPIWISALARAGATVVGVDRAPCAVEGAARVLVADVRDRAAIEALGDEIEAHEGRPSIIVNNAGVDAPPAAGGGAARVQDVEHPDFLHVLDVNVAGTFAVCQALGPRMAASGGGTIVNVGSLYAGRAPDPGLYDHLDPPFLKPPAYGASKAAVVSLTRYLARLWGPHGVRVNTLSPGGVLGDQDAEFVRRFSARVPLGRLAVAEDLTGPLLFLASDASRYVSGQELIVDGGFTA